MGNENSSIQRTPLVPQQRFPRVINSRFVDTQRVVTLQLHSSMFLPATPESSPSPIPAAHEIRDADTDTVVFNVQRSSDGAKLLLLDTNSVPAVALQGFTVEHQLAVYDATHPLPALAAKQTTLLTIETNTRPMEKRLLVELKDANGRVVRIRSEGRWDRHSVALFADRGDRPNVVSQCIAHVYTQPLAKEEEKKKNASDQNPSDQAKSESYCVAVAQGVDLALVVLICAAMDQEIATKNDVYVAPSPPPAQEGEGEPRQGRDHHAMAHSETYRETRGKSAMAANSLMANAATQFTLF